MGSAALVLEDVSLVFRSRRSFFKHSRHCALNSLSFSVARGETFGVIGGNGSGKSTLLKVLAGIYKADSGDLRNFCDTRMLLSLALGFLPELTGRENALLSGVLLGGQRKFVERMMPRIIEFSELEGSIDDPLKTYSSGMRSRLGFAVALMMESELLLIDEVMSVGDAAFRKKAEHAMKKRIQSEQTVIIVSHSPGQIARLCQRAVWLHAGKARMVGRVDEVAGAYEKFSREKSDHGTRPASDGES